MKTTKGQKQSVTYFQTLAERLAEKLPTKTKPFFLSLMLRALLAVARRRTVTTWLQAAQISEGFRSMALSTAGTWFQCVKSPLTGSDFFVNLPS